MTETPEETGPAPLQINSGADDRDTSDDRIPFRLDDDPTILTATRPKMAVLVRILATLGDDSNPLRQAVELEGLLDYVVDKESATHLRGRFLDPDDAVDLLALGPIIQTLAGRWYGGPTGGRAGSRTSPPRTGKRSTVRQPSKG